jgi:WD40 repeat protein
MRHDAMSDGPESPTGPAVARASGAPRPTWPVFICYRQDDGKAAARWLADHLEKRRLPFALEGSDIEPELDVYFDETAPAVGDWTRIHQPALERARAFLMVCSPGAKVDFGEADWVQKELRWWIDRRGNAPLVIDSTGAEDRYVPDAIKERWPRAQRTRVLPDQWARLSGNDRRTEEARALERILSGIRASEAIVRYEDLERERERARLLRRQRSGLVALAVAALMAAGLAVYLGDRAQRNAEDARAQSILAAARGVTDPMRRALLLMELVGRPAPPQAFSLASAVAQQAIPLAVLRGHEAEVAGAAFSPDGSHIVTASWDGTARVWRADGTGTPVVLRGHTREVRSAAFSPDGTRVITASLDGTARVWRVDGTGVPVVLGTQPSGNVGAGMLSATFNSDGTRAATVSDDGVARVWRTDGAGAPVVLRGHERRVRHAAFSPEGTWVVTASDDATARVWRADGAGERVVLRGHEGEILSATFSADGTRVVTASVDGTARVWPADGSAAPVVLRGHETIVWDAAFSPDGMRVVTASADDTARVWRADGAGEPVVLRGHEDTIGSAAISPDGTQVVTTSGDLTQSLLRA